MYRKYCTHEYFSHFTHYSLGAKIGDPTIVTTLSFIAQICSILIGESIQVSCYLSNIEHFSDFKMAATAISSLLEFTHFEYI